jgi:FixJ family two-component response regulator
LALFDENPALVDVVLTDVIMPGGSGPEIVSQLLLRRPSLKVIYMSGYSEDVIVARGILNPGVAFLQKPFTADALRRRVREALDS